ncbi:MAG TPA: sulfite exporter TauE/SafE family protein [Dehalococcoidia bacterium]|nr:sulfite exporter TauE/SafE family protein [Dehalococcoidia bacterium]
MELELAALVVLGVAIGAYGTVVGAGGGFILVPVLLIAYPDMAPDEVTSISLGVVFVSAMSGSVGYARRHRIDYTTGLIFAGASIPGVVAGALIVGYIPQRLFTGLFGLLLLAVAVASLRGRTQAIREPLRGPGVVRRLVVDEEGRQYVYAYKLWQGVAMSVGVGLVSSLFGIGGGVVSVPVMTMLLHMPVQFATATSLFAVSFMSGNATAIHVATRTFSEQELLKTAALAVGALVGAQAGTRIAERVKGRVVLMMLASALGVLSLRLLLRAVFGF